MNIEAEEKFMVKKRIKISLAGIIIFFGLTTTALAIDPEDNIMRNDHDTLLIGVITAMDDEKVVIEAIEYIVSAYDLNEEDWRSQLRPEEVIIDNAAWADDFYVDDYVLASLNQEGEQFAIAWGIYRIERVDMLDWQAWKVEADDELTSIILSDFVNHEGQYTYSIKQDGTVIRHQGDAEVVVYDPEIPTEIQPRTEEVTQREIEEESSNAPAFVLSSIAFCGIVATGYWMYYKRKTTEPRESIESTEPNE